MKISSLRKVFESQLAVENFPAHTFFHLRFFLSWQAVLVHEHDGWICGGTILNEYFILTAAHCVNSSTDLQVLVGELLSF